MVAARTTKPTCRNIAGPRIAAILSIVETCRRLKLPIRDYLTSILPGLAELPVKRVAELTPTAGRLDPN